MDYKKYFLSQRALIEKLNDVKIYRSHCSHPYEKDEIDSYYEDSKLIVGGEVEAFFLNCPPVKLTWEIGKHPDNIYGYILIESFDDIIFGPENMMFPVPKGEEFKGVLWTDDDDDDFIEDRKQYRAFEYVDGSGEWVCLKFYDERGKVTLHYLDKFGASDIPLSFDEYIRVVFTSYGVVDRINLCNPEFYKDPYLIQSELTALKALLPMNDFDEVIKELQTKFSTS